MEFEQGMFPVQSECAIQLNQSPLLIDQVLDIALYKKEQGLSTKMMKDIFGDESDNNVHRSFR